MTIQDITCFMKLAETLNYTQTASELYISQPAVSRHIMSLEKDIGEPLFDRTIKRSVTLTEIGEIYYQGLKQCEEIYANTLKTIDLHTHKAATIINLMRGTTYPDSYIPATTQFMAEHLDFQHFTNFIEYEKFASSINQGEILICSEELMPQSKAYQYIKLNRKPVPYYLVASKQHKAFSNPENVNLNELASTTLFLPKMLPQKMRETLAKTTLQLFGKMPKEILFLDSTDSISLFLRSHECFTISTGWHTNVNASDFKSIPLPMFTDYYAVWNPDKMRNKLAISYIEILAQA